MSPKWYPLRNKLQESLHCRTISVARIVHGLVSPCLLIAVSANCPTGWLYFNSSCFKEFKTALPWTDAKQACESVNSSLASIHSAEENEFIFRHVMSADTPIAAIGFYDSANEGIFVWTDGSDVSFSNWAEFQPDNFNNDQDCGLIVRSINGQWDDNICSHVSRYICRKECA